MKTITMITATIIGTATPLAASSGPEAGGSNLLVVLFLIFGALIVICQLVPGLTLFVSMMKGLFHNTTRKVVPVAQETENII